MLGEALESSPVVYGRRERTPGGSKILSTVSSTERSRSEAIEAYRGRGRSRESSIETAAPDHALSQALSHMRSENPRVGGSSPSPGTMIFLASGAGSPVLWRARVYCLSTIRLVAPRESDASR